MATLAMMATPGDDGLNRSDPSSRVFDLPFCLTSRRDSTQLLRFSVSFSTDASSAVITDDGPRQIN
ncbi:hypothetical protein Bca101_016229 [Brassica carinata]